MTPREFIAAWGGLITGMAIMLGVIAVFRVLDRREARRIRNRVLRPDDNQQPAHGDFTTLPHDGPGRWRV